LNGIFQSKIFENGEANLTKKSAHSLYRILFSSWSFKSQKNCRSIQMTEKHRRSPTRGGKSIMTSGQQCLTIRRNYGF
jgi:hypothetical protein